MLKLNLEPKDKAQEVIKEYLESTASDVLAEKINDGVLIEKDGKRLINRKTLDGFMKYACDEARKQAEKGKNSACIGQDVVFGWAVHYFEENAIEGTLYNEDGTEYKPANAPKQSATAKPAVPPKPQPKPQMSLFELMDEQEQPAEPIQETPPEEPEQSDENINDDYEISEEEQREILAELAEEEERQAKEQRQKPEGSPMYRKYLDIQRKYPDSVIAYRLGDFYEVFGENAVKIAEELDLTLTGRDCGLDERVPMVGFPYHAADNCFKRLLACGHKLAVCETLDDVRCMSNVNDNAIDEDTGEILSEEEMHLFDGDIEEPDELLYEEKQSAKAFDTDALCKLDEILGQVLDVR